MEQTILYGETIFYSDIDEEAISNTFYRKVIGTTTTMQVVVMCLLPKQDIGSETHPYATQFVKVVSGNATIYIDGVSYELSPGMSIMIPPDSLHNIINTSNKYLQLYTIYSPPQHERNYFEITKQ